MPGLIEQAKGDWQKFSSDLNGWGVAITLTAPTAEVANIAGLGTNHHIGVDSDGNAINTKNAHITISEQLLVDAGYPVRDSDNEVAIINHRVSYKDSTGITKEYVIEETFPDETIGMITCILNDFE